MGKAQSKRSVDITTEGKKDEEVIAGKVEKIEDGDDQKPQVNGDATPQENDAKEKKESEESENDKDATTEKSSGDAGGGGDQAPQNGEQSAEEAAASATTPKEDTKEAATGEEEISPLADDSSKKTKKEKVKKKWSFRSISFGKKDKQKPAKTDAEAVSPTTNGEAIDKPAEGANADETKNGEGAEAATKPSTENGEASEKELLNGDGDTTTTTPTEDKSATVATANESTNDTAAAAATNNTTASSSTTTSPSTAPMAADNQTDKKVAAEVAAPILSNGTAEKKPDIVSSPEQAAEKPQQNGTNGEEHADEEEETHAVEIKTSSKSIECNINTHATNINEEPSMAGDGAGDSNATIVITPTPLILEPKTFQQIGAGGDVAENKQADVIVAEPPPLPISPPPSHVVAFALNTDVPSAELEQLENKEQVPTVRIADIEEQPNEYHEESYAKIENIAYNETVAEISNQQILKQDHEMQKMQVEHETGEKELEAKAAATFLVDEITSLATDYVVEAQKQLDDEVLLEEDDELPPPPPSPPSVMDDSLVNNEPSAYEEVVTSVEEVLNQFETKICEMEEKVMNFATNIPLENEEEYTMDGTSSTLSDSNIMAHSDTETLENKPSQIDCEVINECLENTNQKELSAQTEENIEEIKTCENETEISISINEKDIAESAEELQQLEEIPATKGIETPEPIDEEFSEAPQIECADETNENETVEQFEEEFSEAQQMDISETNEHNDTEIDEELSVEQEIVERSEQEHDIDVTSIIVDELNMLNLNSEFIYDETTAIVQENNDNTQKTDEQFDAENKNIKKIDLKTVKVNANNSNTCILVLYYSLLLLLLPLLLCTIYCFKRYMQKKKKKT